MKNLLGWALGLAVLCSACSQKKAEVSSADRVEPAAMMAPPMAEPSATSDNEEMLKFTPPVVVRDGRGRIEAVPRLLIYHAELRLKVEDLARTGTQLESLVQRSGGYLSRAEETRDDESSEWRQEMTIRVRPGQFSSLMAALGRLGTVENKKLSTDDVTAEHADVSARLRTKRAVEQRYVALLAQAKKIQDVLDIEEKIGEVREEIESTESRLKTLNDEVAYSTISLTCYQPLPRPTPDVPIVSLGSRVVEAFYSGWTLLTNLFVGLISIWPLLIVGSAAWLLLRRWRRRTTLLKA